MFLTIRRYSPQNGAVNRASLELLRRQIQADFLPVIQKIPGFHAYYMVNIDNRELMTVSLFETAEGATESGRCAAEYTLRNPLIFELGRPVVTEGEVLTSADLGQKNPEVSNGGHATAALAL